MAVREWIPEGLAADLSMATRGKQLWLVGGAVRDRLLDRSGPDLDFVAETDARILARRFADAVHASYYDLDRERDTGRVVVQAGEGRRIYMDFARLRGADIDEDLRHRDFTINALGVPLDQSGDLLDPTGGLQDLKDGIVRACYVQAVQDDPVRALRAVRIANELGFSIEPRTIEHIQAGGPLLEAVSAERIRDELVRMLGVDHPAAALRVLDHLELLGQILPELETLKGSPYPHQGSGDAWAVSLGAVSALSRLLMALQPQHDPEAAGGLVISQVTSHIGRFRAPLSAELDQELTFGRRVRELLHLSALLHPLVSVDTEHSTLRNRSDERGSTLERVRQRARSLRFSNAEIERMTSIILGDALLRDLSDQAKLDRRAIYRFLVETGPAASQAVLLRIAARLAVHAPAAPPRGAWLRLLGIARQLLESHFGQGVVRIGEPELVKGQDLVDELGIPPGPEVGKMLSLIREAQAVGEVRSREAGLRLAERCLRGELDSGEGKGQAAN
jgi:tRNA nucleotidyltransferase/poly(A) polymerase